MALQKGQRVRVTYQAIYEREKDGCHELKWAGCYQTLHVPEGAIIEPVEVLRVGDIYRTNNHRVVMYLGFAGPFAGPPDPWMLLGTPVIPSLGIGMRIADEAVQRPLMLLVRDGVAQ